MASHAFGEIGKAWDVSDTVFMDQMTVVMNDPSSWKENTGDTDYWKLAVKNGKMGFEWDGSLKYDLSLLTGSTTKVDSLTPDVINKLWDAYGSSGTGFATKDEFAQKAGTFDTANQKITALMDLFKVQDKNNTPSDTVFNPQRNAMLAALRDVGNSGLLLKIGATVAKSGDGPQIFANGSGTLTSDYGARIASWKPGENYPLQWHAGWDASAGAGASLVASFTGTYGLDSITTGGLSLNIQDGNRQVQYMHSDPSSIMNFVGLYSTQGVSLNDSGRLTGVIQNMIIGSQGNTGSESTNSHVHVQYGMVDPITGQYENTDPAKLYGNIGTFFGSYMTSDVPYISGWQKDSRPEAYKISEADILSAYKWSNLNTTRDKEYVDFNRFISNSNNNAHYSKTIDWYNLFRNLRSK
jgi:hypothetical protein